MGDLKKILNGFEQRTKRSKRIAFGSGQQRTTFPDATYTSRFGLVAFTPYHGKRSRGPGTYSAEIFDNFVSLSEKRISNVHGYVLRSEPRFKRMYDIPSNPLEYYEEAKPIKKAARPFGSGVPISKPVLKSVTTIPGPGTYGRELIPKSKVKRLGSFGGKTSMVPPVEIKCVPINEDLCDQCKQAPVGVYYQTKNKNPETLCRNCYGQLALTYNSRNLVESNRFDSFVKVRDCTFFHDHARSKAAVRLKLEKELAKQRRLETYFNRYF